MNELQELLAWAQQELKMSQNATDPYVVDEFYDRFHDGECNAYEQVIDQIKSMMHKENSNFLDGQSKQ
jgi:hypothetical protein